MDVSRDVFPGGTVFSADVTRDYPKISRRRFVVTAEEEANGFNFARSLTSFLNSSGGVPQTSNLADLLRQAGVPDYELVGYKCYEHARRLDLGVQGVSIDDAAIIASFTYQAPGSDPQNSPFAILNSSLASQDRTRREAIFPYASALLSALRKLKRFVNRGHLYRGISCKNEYKVGSEEKWGRISSTSLSKDIAMENFLGTTTSFATTTITGTIFIISKGWGYDIRPFSFFDEEEIVLDIERTVKITAIRSGNIQEVDVELADTGIVEIPAICLTSAPSEPPTYRERRGPPSQRNPARPPEPSSHPPVHHGPPPCPYCGHMPGPPRGPPPSCPGCGRRLPPPPGPPRGPPPSCPYCNHPPPPPPPCQRCHRRPPPPRRR